MQTTTITSLSGLLIGTQILTSFTTGEGPGIVNAPVAPECIYVGIGGAQSGVSVIDLNGFGQGTGDLSTTRFPIHVQTQLGSGAVPAYAPQQHAQCGWCRCAERDPGHHGFDAALA